MSFPAPNRDHHQRFCTVEGWELVRNATGRAVAHHVTYELILTDGRILRTRISRPVDRTTYGKSIWAAILRDQLEVEPASFWACVKNDVLPDRGAPTVPQGSIPLAVVKALIDVVGLAETEVTQMSRDEAIARLNRHWSEH